jgi:hypothetical protein
MAAIAGDFCRILGGFAVRTAILAVIPGHASTTRVCTFLSLVVSHLYLLRSPRFTAVRFTVRGKSEGERRRLEPCCASLCASPYLSHGKWQRSRNSPSIDRATPIGQSKRGLKGRGPHAGLGRGLLACLRVGANKRAVPFSLPWHLVIRILLCFTDLELGCMIATAQCTHPASFDGYRNSYMKFAL